MRQFRDGNTSFDTDTFTDIQFTDYAGMCGTALARAHIQSTGSEQVAGYLGKGTTFDTAMAEWAEAYAHQSSQDYELLLDYLR